MEAPTSQPTLPQFPGARSPDRVRRVDSFGVEIAVHEWGREDAPPVLLAHGGFDFARTFEVFAPMLADAGWRVVAWDQRGHGDSGHAALYGWQADVRDMLSVLDATSAEPLPVVGHSKGAGVAMSLIHSLPRRFTRFVAVDGLPSERPQPDVAEHQRSQIVAESLAEWLDHRRRTAGAVRKPGTIDELARRRGRMNPRLSLDWLRFLVTVGARRDADGWRWKVDPTLRFGGFGPWRPQWMLASLPRFPVPLLGILGLVPEPMGPETTPDSVRPYLPPGARVEAFADTGHFVHIERPRRVADLVIEFLA